MGNSKRGRLPGWVAERVTESAARGRLTWRGWLGFVAVPLVAGAVVGAVLSGVWRGESSAPDESTEEGQTVRVRVWEDGSASILSGTVRIDGKPHDLSGRAFCLYGELCTDSDVPYVVRVPSVDGHAPCWGVKAGTTVAWCADGYTVGF